MEEKNYITPAGHKRLQVELLQLLDVERPKIVEIVHWAASNGDRSENGDYIYGKKRLREIDRRIRFLNKRLEFAVLVDNAARISGDQDADQVFLLESLWDFSRNAVCISCSSSASVSWFSIRSFSSFC
jgi:transcription elongation factor GreB